MRSDMATAQKRSRGIVTFLKRRSKFSLVSLLLFGIYAIAQGASKAEFLSTPVTGVAGASGQRTVTEPIWITTGNIIGNHLIGAMAFGVFVITLAAVLTLHGQSLIKSILIPILVTLTTFLAPIGAQELFSLFYPTAYISAALILGLLYGSLGTLSALVWQKSIKK